MFRMLALMSVLLLPAVTWAEERICVRDVGYRLVGEDAPAPEKARMVEEQVLASVERAGHEALHGDCEGEGAPVLAVSVAESGALYDISIALADAPAHEEQFTGPFAGMLKLVRIAVEQVLAEWPASAPEPAPESPAGAGEEPEPLEGATGEPGGPEQPQAQPGEPDDEPKPPPEPSATDGDLNPLWASSLALTAVGGAAMIAGVVLLVVDDPCIDEDAHGCKERFDSSAAGIPLAGLGGIAVGVGIAGLVLLDRRRPAAEPEPGDAPRPETAAALVPVRGGAAAGVSVSF